MRDDVIDRLIRLNREFYQTFATSFAETRARLQPGVSRSLRKVSATDTVLDLGCGNGGVARFLAKHDHSGPYYGLDSSSTLIEIARENCPHPQAHFFTADITQSEWMQHVATSYDQIFAFAVLHHIPGKALRLQILKQIHSLLAEKGKITLSNWNFPASERLQKRILPWSTIEIDDQDVDPGDTLLDWKRGGYGLRYVHHFNEAELNQLAHKAGFRVLDMFYSDGEGGRLGFYQVWDKS